MMDKQRFQYLSFIAIFRKSWMLFVLSSEPLSFNDSVKCESE